MTPTAMDERVRALNQQPIRPGGRYILYWCRWNRRVASNHALLHAAGKLINRGRPVTLHLSQDWPWARQLAAAFDALAALPLLA